MPVIVPMCCSIHPFKALYGTRKLSPFCAFREVIGISPNDAQRWSFNSPLHSSAKLAHRFGNETQRLAVLRVVCSKPRFQLWLA